MEGVEGKRRERERGGGGGRSRSQTNYIRGNTRAARHDPGSV